MSPQRRALSIIGLLSAAAIVALFWLIYGVETGSGNLDLRFLPTLNASLNAAAASALLLGLFCIRTGRKRAHGWAMATAFAASSLFLLGYIIHHTVNGDSLFLRQGWLRPLYFTILISHILLSIVALPLVLSTLFFAASRNWPLHTKLARLTWPIWLYVSVSGVLVFVFLRFLNT